MEQDGKMSGCQGTEPLGRLIYQTSLMMQNYADRVLRPYDLTLEQFHPIKVLNEVSQSLTQRELGEAVQKTPANVTRILDRLEDKQLIARSPNPADRRAFLVELTDRGTALVGEVTCLFEKLSLDILQGITQNNQQITQATLTKMMANLEKMAAEFEPPKA